MDKQDFDWRKASYSNGSGNCVEVGHAVSVVMVRDTKDRAGAALSFTSEAWRAFAVSVKGIED